MRILISAQEVDTLLVLHTPTAMASSMAAAEAMIRVVSETGGNVLTCWIGGETALPARNLFVQARHPELWLTKHRGMGVPAPGMLPSKPGTSDPNAAFGAPDIRTRHGGGASCRAQDPGQGENGHGDPEAKVVLAAYGLPTVPTRIAGSPAGCATAESLGFPVAVKLLSPDIANCSDVDGVVLDLDTPPGVGGSGTAHPIKAAATVPGCSSRWILGTEDGAPPR